MKLSSITRYLFIGILFPLLIQYVMYYRFTSNYQPNIFSESGFRTFYENSVFKYRVLGRELHLWLYHKLKERKSLQNMKEGKIYEKRLFALDPNADPVFYMTYYIINGVFAMLLALGLLYLFDHQAWFNMNETDKIFTTVILTLIIAITQFVPTPYDMPAYFFEVITFTVFLKYLRSNNNWLLLLVTCALIFAATLIRESAVLILSLMAAIYFTVNGLNWNWIKKMMLPVASFFVAYIGLRMYVNSTTVQISENSKLSQNLSLRPSAMLGIFIAVIIFYLLFKAATTAENKKLVRNFIVFTLPYVVMIFFIGLLIEFRLWVPLMIGTAMLYRLNLKAFDSSYSYGEKKSVLSANT